MATAETKVTNRSGSEVELKLSNAGAHLILKSIKYNDSYVITSEPNATYREYWVGSIEGTPIIFSSDDCLENKEIIIQPGGHSEMIKRDIKSTEKGWIAWILESVGIKTGS